jgi:hypothetical protein
MKSSFLALAIVAAVVVVVSPVVGKEKKKKEKTAEAVKQEQTSTVPKTEAGWTEVTTNAPKLVKVTYRLDGSTIIIRFRNLNAEKAMRVKYHAKWKKDWNGRMVDDSTADGLSVRLKKSEDFPLEIRTGAKGVKDIVITIDASEMS